MAILTHEVDGQFTADFSTIVVYGGSYIELTQTATAEGGIDSTEIVGVEDIDTSISGDYIVGYTANETAGETVTIYETITVQVATTNVDTNFDLGNEDRSGEDLVGTKYDALVDAANAGTIPSETSSAYFDEGALDPYEVKHSK